MAIQSFRPFVLLASAILLACSFAMGQPTSDIVPLIPTTNVVIPTNAPGPTKSNEPTLIVVSHPVDSTNSASGQKSGGITSFFRNVKSFFGVDNVVHLFNGTDLDNFYPWLADKGTFVDPDGVFSVENGMIRISGQHQGFLATKAQFGDYKLVAEFKWGDATWYQNKRTARNSGIFVNAFGLDGLDMKAIELQIAEPNGGRKEGTGDVVLHGGAKMAVANEMKGKPWDTFYRKDSKDLDASAGQWNKMEIAVEGDQVRVTVNGKLAVEGRRATPSSGKILLQSNGAEIFIRRLDLYPLETNNVPSLLHNENSR